MLSDSSSQTNSSSEFVSDTKEIKGESAVKSSGSTASEESFMDRYFALKASYPAAVSV